MRRLDLIIGPNGAGKSTIVRYVLAPVLPGPVFVNAEEIARHEFPSDPEARSYHAAQIAERTRQRLLRDGVNFIAETVGSHPSKEDLVRQAQDRGFSVFLHVVLVPVELSLARVLARVEAGGHSVPPKKITSRYERVWPLAREAALIADAAAFYDNSGVRPIPVAQLTSGVVTSPPRWPAWTPEALLDLDLDAR